jgi:hypothetical protein
MGLVLEEPKRWRANAHHIEPIIIATMARAEPKLGGIAKDQD